MWMHITEHPRCSVAVRASHVLCDPVATNPDSPESWPNLPVFNAEKYLNQIYSLLWGDLWLRVGPLAGGTSVQTYIYICTLANRAGESTSMHEYPPFPSRCAWLNSRVYHATYLACKPGVTIPTHYMTTPYPPAPHRALLRPRVYHGSRTTTPCLVYMATPNLFMRGGGDRFIPLWSLCVGTTWL